jgi:hypothetical protein
LIAQQSLKPFRKDGSDIKTNELHMFPLPWPTKALQDLGETDVTLRVTLSYFIEPSPGWRGWKTKFRYASCGLRFDVLRPTESPEEFGKRINKAARDEDEELDSSGGDSTEWLLGDKLRRRGSLHSDYWRGPAAYLAAKGIIAVFPVRGWWSERPHLARWDDVIRYSLIVSIRTPREDVDIYTPVAAQLPIVATV